jgi:hypothetical protein
LAIEDATEKKLIFHAIYLLEIRQIYIVPAVECHQICRGAKYPEKRFARQVVSRHVHEERERPELRQTI